VRPSIPLGAVVDLMALARLRLDFRIAGDRPPAFVAAFRHLALVLAVLAPWSARAVTINFDDLESGYCLPNPQCSPSAGMVLSDTLMNLGVVFGRSGQSAGVAVIDGARVSLAPSSPRNSIVGLNPAGNIPSNFTGSVFFGFFTPGAGTPAVSDYASFTLGDACCDADRFEIRAYGLDEQMLTSFIRPVDSSEVGRFPVEVWVDGIHRVEIERLVGAGTQFGYSVDDLSFELDNQEPSLDSMPEPSTWLTLLSGLAGYLGLRRYCHRRQ
jgi:hypothetical protein